ncbi:MULTISPECIES: FAD-binding oxidoreductase [unclassified Wenzhouxiangella]|uniref:FAD-binding oxidoreductase n=1 Tax=unclassified Wenzhouxiangella TaxID=2613841 RepID=UPI000E32A4A1|nr:MULTISPECIES: FAD-binding oxidoreductase [unclassified Wenzhouxiangella]RFF26689.1 FAD-binding oxidoreductase [Wenzhouxiangella sp. 15181]RFP69341.1 FAD-binding oxidoreductase [Wenzhouxiangella sp. 15190]
MRRWNGWGDESIDMTLPASAESLLSELLGSSAPLPDASLSDVVGQVPESRLAGIDHALLERDAEIRIRHARGQSLPDWLAMRSGHFGIFPDAVARPESGEQVRELLELAAEHDAIVIPYGGGTSVAGHITPAESQRPIITLALTKMNRLLDLDEASGVATFGAGARGPEVEAQLRARGYTLGHFPQSWELSTLGGWVASRSSGQQSLRYGRIEQLFAGGRIETPSGPLDLPTFPASAAGPDLRELVLGSEGRLGVFTEVCVRVSPLPDEEIFETLFLPDWQRAFDCARELVRQRVGLSMLRVANPAETFTGLRLAVDKKQLGWLERLLRLRGIGEGKCMLTLGCTGHRPAVHETQQQARTVLRRHGAVALMPGKLGRKWAHGRFRYPYLREALWRLGYAVDTFETALDWSRVDGYIRDAEKRVGTALSDQDEPVHVFTHLSHIYRQGSSAYTSYLYRVGNDYDTALERWRIIKAAASQAIVDWGGTISHQHGVGRDHAPYLQAEKGELGLAALGTLFRRFDPDGRMNPGVLLPEDKP